MRKNVSSLPVSQLLFSDNNLLDVPVRLSLHFLPIFGCVAQADTSDVAQVLGRKLKLVNIPPKKEREKCWTSTRLKPPPYSNVTPQSICSARNEFFFFFNLDGIIS